MAIMSSSVGLTRYRIVEETPDSLLRELPEKLKEFAFRDIDNSSEERSFGWANIDDMLDMSWTASPPEKGHYFAFALRLDTRRIQPAVLKKHYQIAMNQELEQAKAQGREYISRDRKKELKDQVILRLRARTLPVPAIFDVVWDQRRNRLMLATTNAKIRSLFEDHFNVTFGLNLEPLAPFYAAMEILGEESASLLENLEPTIFV